MTEPRPITPVCDSGPLRRSGLLFDVIALLLSRASGHRLSPLTILLGAAWLPGLALQLALLWGGLMLGSEPFAVVQIFGAFAGSALSVTLGHLSLHRKAPERTRTGHASLLATLVANTPGAAINVLVAGLLFHVIPIWWISSLAGGFAAVVWFFRTLPPRPDAI